MIIKLDINPIVFYIILFIASGFTAIGIVSVIVNIIKNIIDDGS
jgi:hypothetical protein